VSRRGGTSRLETPDHDGAFSAPERRSDRVAWKRGRAPSDHGWRGCSSRRRRGIRLLCRAAGHGRGDRRLRRPRRATHRRARNRGQASLASSACSPARQAFFTAVVREPGKVLVIEVDRVRALISQDPALGDLLLRAYFMRRELLIGLGAGFRIIGSRFSPAPRRLREFVARNRLPHRWVDLDQTRAQRPCCARWHPSRGRAGRHLARSVPAQPLKRGARTRSRLVSPALARAACDLLVVGAGPAGLAASVYGASEGLDTMTLDANRDRRPGRGRRPGSRTTSASRRRPRGRSWASGAALQARKLRRAPSPSRPRPWRSSRSVTTTWCG